MRFEVRIPLRWDVVTFAADGIPPDTQYPEWFVADDGWVWPASSVVSFRLAPRPCET